MPSFFEMNDYRVLLKAALADLQIRRPGATLQSLAEACRIQKTYLSKVLNHGGNLSSDQIYLAAKYFKLNEKNRSFLFLLHDLSQCAVTERRQEIEREIQKLRADELKSQNHIKVQVRDEPANLSDYYTEPYLQLIHIFLTIESFRAEPFLIASKLQIEKERFLNFLNRLASLELISIQRKSPRRGDENKLEIKVLKDNLHLANTSNSMRAYRTLTRLQALEKINHLSGADAYTFSAIFSTNPKIKNEIHKKFLIFLKEIQDLSTGSNETDVYQINFDLLKWS